MKNNHDVVKLAIIGFGFLIILGAGCDKTNPEPNVSNADPAIAGIIEVFEDNYPDKAGSFEVEITEKEGDLLKGTMSMSGINNHVFYAANVNGEWDVIYDPKQQPYDCELLKGYNFSDEMIAGCKEPDAEFTIADAQGIQSAFADIYHKNIEDITIKVDQYTANHARGSVQFAGEQGGGMFLAVKDQGAWDVVIDGNGAYECKFVEPYNFPEEMINDCY